LSQSALVFVPLADFYETLDATKAQDKILPFFKLILVFSAIENQAPG
jgi:hypothetical protein